MSEIARPLSKPRKPGFLEDMLLGVTVENVPKLVPGIALSALVVVLSVLITGWINAGIKGAWGIESLVSYIMMSILIGVVVRTTVGIPEICKPGVSFCVKKLLRLGIMVMGIRLSIFEAVKIGIWGVPIVIIAVTTGLVVTTYFTRLLKLSDKLGTLIAVGTGICGVSAIVATAPGINAKDEEVAYAVANITIFGMLAIFVYPYLANFLFSGNQVMAGLFEGTAIHDTAQVTGAGLIYDQIYHIATKPSAADVAVVTKLVRNLMMVIVIPLMAFLYAGRVAKQGGQAKKVNIVSLFPIFILGFVAMAAIRSVGNAGVQGYAVALGIWDQAGWKGTIALLSDSAGYILATAVAGAGLSTSLQTIKSMGVKPFYVGLLSAATVGAAAMIAVLILGPMVRF